MRHANVREHTHTAVRFPCSALITELDEDDLGELLVALDELGIKKPHRKKLEKVLRQIHDGELRLGEADLALGVRGV